MTPTAEIAMMTAGTKEAGCLGNGLESCPTRHRCPEIPSWYLRAGTVIAAPLVSMQLRTSAAIWHQNRESGLPMIPEVTRRFEQIWRRLESAHPCSTTPLPRGEQARPA